MQVRNFVSFATLAGVVFFGQSSAAEGPPNGGLTPICGADIAQTASVALFNTHGCWAEYFNWHVSQYNLHFSDWTAPLLGWDDACNLGKSLAIGWNASYLIGYGNLKGATPGRIYSAHTSGDYLSYARAFTPAHDPYHQIQQIAWNDPKTVGQYNHNALSIDSIDTGGKLYPSASGFAHPAALGADFLHEATHSWDEEHGVTVGTNGSGHLDGMFGLCQVLNNCDFFWWHSLGSYPPDQLSNTDVSHLQAAWDGDISKLSQIHSPVQMEVEYQCDIFNAPAWGDNGETAWIPASVKAVAACTANFYAANRFVNPAPSCGTPRPW